MKKVFLFSERLAKFRGNFQEKNIRALLFLYKTQFWKNRRRYQIDPQTFLGDCNETRTHNHLVRKQTLNQNKTGQMIELCCEYLQHNSNAPYR